MIQKSDAEIAEPHFQHPQIQKNQPAAGQIDTGEVSTPDQLRDLTNRIQALESILHGRVVFSTGIIGLFETVSVAPTGIPLSPYDQIKIARISGTSYLYIYDNVNKTLGGASNGWLRVTIA